MYSQLLSHLDSLQVGRRREGKKEEEGDEGEEGEEGEKGEKGEGGRRGRKGKRGRRERRERRIYATLSTCQSTDLCFYGMLNYRSIHSSY